MTPNEPTDPAAPPAPTDYLLSGPEAKPATPLQEAMPPVGGSQPATPHPAHGAQPPQQTFPRARLDTPYAEVVPQPPVGGDTHTPVPAPETADADDNAGQACDTEEKAEAIAPETDASVVQNLLNNSGTVVGVQNVSEIHRLRGTPLPDKWIYSRLHAYLPDDATTQSVTSILTAHRVAVIHAAAGTGRYTTALHTLSDRSVKTIRQVRREPGDTVDLEGLKDENTGWILDLRDKEETLRTGFGHHLKEVETHLRETRSFVIVVTHSDTWARVADEAIELAHALIPPEARDILRTHLTCHNPPVHDLEKWHGENEITSKHLSGATPAEAARWAHIIGAAVDLNRSTIEPKSFDELMDSVIQSAQNWRGKLRMWHTANIDSAHRNYLLSAAALDGAPAEIVYEAHSTLGRALDDLPQPARGQQGPGIIQLTHSIGAELGKDDRIRFLSPGYAEAVVDYFWVDRPHRVAAFTGWTAAQAASLPRDLGIPLADRVTQWAIRYTLVKQSFFILRAIATHWADTQHLGQHAQDLLVAAAIDPTTGKRTREQYLAWAKAPDTAELTERKRTPTALKRALAGALAELGAAYPQIALKRLSELAANTTDTTVTDAVGDSLMILWEQQGLQGRIRTTLTSWFRAPQDHYASAARRAFLHLAARTNLDGIPVLLAREDADPDPWTLTGWRCSLDGEISPGVQGAINTWLNAVLTRPGLQPAVMKTFTEALLRSSTDRTYLAERYIVLNHAANGWEPAHAGQQPTERTRLRDALLIALREADPTAPTSLHDVSTTP